METDSLRFRAARVVEAISDTMTVRLEDPEGRFRRPGGQRIRIRPP